MARVVRLEGEGAVYHVIVRGNERKAVFRDDEDRRGYLDRLAKGKDRGQSLLVGLFSPEVRHPDWKVAGEQERGVFP